MFSKLPPVGAPIYMKDILASLAGLSKWEGDRPLEKAFLKITKKKHALVVGSGRMAITMILKALAENDQRNRVIIPGYTCYTVAAAVARADMLIDPVDIDPATLDFDYDRLREHNFNDVLAIIPSGLLGFPANLPELTKLCEEKNIHLIDDAAQSLGAEIGGRPCGSYGAAGVFSMGRGKNISTMGGGAIITDSDQIDAHLRKLTDNIHRMSMFESVVRSAAYSLVLRPAFYGIATKLPFVEVGTTRFDPHFNFAIPSGFRRKLGEQMLKTLPALQEYRIKAAKHYDQLLADHSGIKHITAHDQARPVYLRYPIRVSRSARGRIYQLLNKKGLGAAIMYPEPVNKIPGISDHLVDRIDDLPQSDLISRSILTLPTHPFVNESHQQQMAEILKNNLREA